MVLFIYDSLLDVLYAKFVSDFFRQQNIEMHTLQTFTNKYCNRFRRNWWHVTRVVKMWKRSCTGNGHGQAPSYAILDVWTPVIQCPSSKCQSCWDPEASLLWRFRMPDASDLPSSLQLVLQISRFSVLKRSWFSHVLPPPSLYIFYVYILYRRFFWSWQRGFQLPGHDSLLVSCGSVPWHLRSWYCVFGFVWHSEVAWRSHVAYLYTEYRWI